jgi:heme exporter protein A
MSGVRLRARGLAKRFGPRWIFRKLDLDLSLGQVMVVAGPNGSGKTTLLKVLAHLLPPTEGELHVEGEGGAGRNLVGLSSPEQALYGSLSGIENYLFFARLRGLGCSASDAERRMSEFGLEGLGHERVDTYSTGMKQRLRLAVACQHEPPVLLLDEPASGLDDAGRSLIDAILSRQRRRGIAFVATNDPSEYRHGNLRLELGC